jgi:hypothetical protein
MQGIHLFGQDAQNTLLQGGGKLHPRILELLFRAFQEPVMMDLIIPGKDN